MTNLRLFVEASIEQARQSIEPDFSMRSSIQQPFEYSSKERGISQDFEDVSREENKSRAVATGNSVGVGSNFSNLQSMNAETDVRNLVNYYEQSVNTQAVGTDEKELNAVVNTQEFGSQIQRDVREASCDMSIETVSKGSQFVADVVEQEINC